MKHWFLLRRQPVAERDHLLDVFSAEEGLVPVRVSPPARLPDLFELCEGDWQTGRDWSRLKASEVRKSFDLKEQSLICALYITELLVLLLPRSEPVPALYRLYHQTLEGLETTSSPEPWLRVFEQRLLLELGYGVSWDQAQGGPVVKAASYRYDAVAGFVESESGYPGAVLLDIGAGRLGSGQALLVARQVLRGALDAVLPRSLVSRELLDSRRSR